MPFSAHAAMLGLQLIVTVADHAPDFDVGPTCRESSVPDCPNMEKIARDKLVRDWPTFTAQDKAMCGMEERIAGPPSYVGWLTCLGINANAHSPEAKGGDSLRPRKDLAVIRVYHLTPPRRDFTCCGSDQISVGHRRRRGAPAALHHLNRDCPAQVGAALLKATQKFAGIFNRSQS